MSLLQQCRRTGRAPHIADPNSQRRGKRGGGRMGGPPRAVMRRGRQNWGDNGRPENRRTPQDTAVLRCPAVKATI